MYYKKSHKLENVLYDIRGPVSREAQRLEEEGYHILKLHTGNPAAFGFDTPDEMLHDVIVNLKHSQGYLDDSRGLFPARKAVFQYYQEKGVEGIDVDDIYIGNGVSELIMMALQALLNTGYEVLIPAPDYPLWTAATNLAGGKPVHYMCDESSGWIPDLKDIKKKASSKTRAIVIINPNNPTGAVYPREVLEEIVDVAREHELIIFSDEIYDKILYDSAVHVPTSLLAPDLLCITFNGLSKSYRAAGFRAGWMAITGTKETASDYMEGLEMLSSTRLCANVPAQFAVQTALGGYQSINDLVKPGGRLYEQRNVCYQLISEIPGVSCVKPQGALYLFPKLDRKKFNIKNDQKLVLDLLLQEHVLIVQGTGFNWPERDHIRIVFLPAVEDLKMACEKIGNFLANYRQE
ncbi:MAG: aminotransferase class I/II-fold pyridoxal phosphate-dependent enzyme [Chitinivibrionales bacterium]|nr:aminotransferase class I/II-fold pyridoxal phosphate-dependent enzyme [Chitinivibrionales bacterium]